MELGIYTMVRDYEGTHKRQGSETTYKKKKVSNLYISAGVIFN